MNKTQGNNESFFNRRGSFSTHGSSKGVNLLGWGEGEVLNDRQKRDVLIKAKSKIDTELFELKKTRKTWSSADIARASNLRLRAGEVLLELSKFKSLRRNRGDDLGDYIIKVCFSKMTRPEWACVMAEAQRLFAEGNTIRIGE